MFGLAIGEHPTYQHYKPGHCPRPQALCGCDRARAKTAPLRLLGSRGRMRNSIRTIAATTQAASASCKHNGTRQC